MINSKIERNAKKVIDNIGSVLVGTDESLHTYTCGDLFLKNLVHLKNELYELHQSPKFVESIVLGGFGGGKTHFLESIMHTLRYDLSEKPYVDDCVICRIDITDIDQPEDFEFNIVKHLQFPDGRGYEEILHECYKRISEKFKRLNPKLKTPIVGDHVSKMAYVNLLLQILNASSGITPYAAALDFIAKYNIVGNAYTSIRKRFSKKPETSILEEAPKEQKRFIEAYFKIIENPNHKSPLINSPSKELSRDSKLMDLILRILKLADVKMVVILFDELESLNRKDIAFLKNFLERIRGFRDSFNRVYDRRESYPSTGLVFFSTELFFKNEIQNYSRALYSRWEQVDKIILGPLRDIDIDNLIFDLRKLYFWAGYDLKPITVDSSYNEVVEMRDMLRSQLEGGIFSTREVVKTLKDIIEARWVNG